jgi:O-antigen/teichoic acid export membrane protein
MGKDTIQYFLSRILPALASLALIVIAIRFLGPQEYGQFALVYAAVMIVNTLSFGWIRQSIQRFFCSDRENLHLLVNRFFYLTFFSIAAGILLLSAVLLLVFSLEIWEILVVVTFFGLYTLFLFHISVHRAREQNRTAAWIESAYHLFTLGLFCGIIFGYGFQDYRIIFVSMALSLMVTEIARLILISRIREKVEILHLFWDKRFTSKVIEYGRPMTLWLVLSYTLSVADRFILKFYHGYYTAGVYSAINDLLLVFVTLICMPILLAYHPKVIELWNSNHRKEAVTMIREALSFEILAGLIIFIAVMVVRENLYSNFLGIRDKEIHAVTVILILNAFLWQVILLLQKPMEIFARKKFKNIAVLITLAINIAGNLIFVPRFGYFASAFSALVSYAIYIVLLFFLYRRISLQTTDQND